MKKVTLFLLALSVTAMLSGCKKTEPETEAPTEPPTEATEQMTQPVTEAQTEPPTEKEDSMNRTRYLKGLVKSSDVNTLTIQTERGKELQFTITGADIQVANGITAGSNVTVVYKGKVSGTDTSGATVQMVMDLGTGETPVTEGELMTEAEEEDPNAGAGTIGGTIEDLSIDRIVIVADDGESYYFSQYGTEINLVNGFKQGNYVTIDYNGDIYGPNLVEATKVTDNDPASGETAVIAGPSSEEGYSYLNGTVQDYTMTTVSILTDEGEELSFDTTNATHCYENGVLSGNYVTIEYKGEISGSDTTGVTVAAVYDYTAENAGTAGGETGTQGTTEGTAADTQAGDASADTGADAQTAGAETTDGATANDAA